MDSQFFRKYADIIQAAHTRALQEADAAPVSQAELAKLYASAKTHQFVKNTPVALVPFTQLDQMVGADAAEKVKQLAGAVDKTSYDKAYQEGGYVVFQWNSKNNEPDIYIANPNVVRSKYVKFTGALPTDAKARSKIPSLVVLQHMNIDPAKIPFYVKVVPVEMIKVDDVGLAGKTIHTNWGEQQVQPGGYLVREDNGHIYTVAPDAQGLPIGYIKSSMNESTTADLMDLPATDPLWASLQVDLSKTKPSIQVRVTKKTGKYESQTYGYLTYKSNQLTGKLTIPNGTEKKVITVNLADANHPLMKKVLIIVNKLKKEKAAAKKSTPAKPPEGYDPATDPSRSSWWNR